jgi:hypothetical protein
MENNQLPFPGLLAIVFGLFSVVIGTLVDRLSLIAEEYHHLKECYDGSWKKMIKACFSGIRWGPVIVLVILNAVIFVLFVNLKHRPWFELGYLVSIFTGIGTIPLVMELLHLNTQSKVRISAILEEGKWFPGYNFAWYYYRNYLRHALPKFKESISRFFSGQSESVKLSLNKLVLLIPLDCYTKDNLEEVDGNIRKIFDTENEQDHFRFSVYRLTVENEQKYFAIQYVKEPLETLREMSNSEQAKSVNKGTCKNEVKLLHKALSGILEDPPDQDFKGMCVLVPFAESLENLQNGGLVRRIMDIIQPLCDTQNDSGASTSENSSEMAHTESPQSDQVQQVMNDPVENLYYSETNNSKSSMRKVYPEIRFLVRNEFLYGLFAGYSKSDFKLPDEIAFFDDLLRLHSKLLKLFSFRIQI